MRRLVPTSADVDPAEGHPPWQRPIEDYGFLGDTRTGSLVSSHGSIDWLCVPRFDGEPIFGRLVGGADAGTFRLGPADPAPVVARRYLPETATLETTWTTQGATLTLTEGMVADITGRLLPPTLIVRQLTAKGGPIDAVIEFDPRLGDAHIPPRREIRGDILVCTTLRIWTADAAAGRRG